MKIIYIVKENGHTSFWSKNFLLYSYIGTCLYCIVKFSEIRNRLNTVNGNIFDSIDYATCFWDKAVVVVDQASTN